MSHTVPLAPADRLALIIEGLCQAIARRCGLAGPRLAGPFIILIWSRLRRITTRFAANAARHAITPPAPFRPSAPLPAAKRPARLRRSQPLLSRRKAWLLRLVPETASGAAQLRHFLADPEVAALFTQAPHLRRILHPLCHMLGIRAAGIRAAEALLPPPPDAAPAAPPTPCHAPKQAVPIAFAPWSTPPPSPDAAPPARPLHIRA